MVGSSFGDLMFGVAWWFAMVGAPSEHGVVTDDTNSLNFLTLPLLLFFFSAPLLRKVFRNRSADSADGTEE